MSILDSYVGKTVVVRSCSSGVFVGTVKAVEPSGEGRSRVILNQSRRLWRWKAKAGVALSGVAAHGLDEAESKIDAVVDEHMIDDVLELIPTGVLYAAK
jgi:ferredoxin-fold anticodon binding domain-containing protein